MKLHAEDIGTGNPSPYSHLLTKAQLAPIMGVTTRTVDQWMFCGHLPYLKIGRTVRFRLADVERYLSEHCLMARRAMRGAVGDRVEGGAQ